MKRPRIEDTRTPEGHQSIEGRAVNVYKYSKLQDEYIDYLEEQVKNYTIPDVVGRSEQLKAFLQEIENDKTYILNDYYKNKAKRLGESL
jgi:hypothetical protein